MPNFVGFLRGTADAMAELSPKYYREALTMRCSEPARRFLQRRLASCRT